MKRLILWVVLLAGIITTFSSCEEDPDPIPAIVGTWSRTEYEFTELPSSHSYWEEHTEPVLLSNESGYTFVFNADLKYSRNFSPYMNDKGTWEQDGSKLTISPDDPDDLDVMEAIGYVGPEFDIEGEITDIRMVLSGVTVFFLPSNASIDAAGGDLSQVPDEEWVEVDVTLLTKFNKLN